jgi:F-type H+-transporting ATPase subunit b
MLMTSVLAQAEDNGWGGKLPIIPQPAELIIGLLFFAVAYWAVAKFVVPRFEELFAQRTAAIEGGIKKAEVAQAEAAEALQQYRGELAEARAERTRIIQQASEEATTVAAEIRQRAQEEAERITTAASQQIQAERQQALVQLRQEFGRLSVDLASRIVGESLEDEARQRRVVDNFLAELESDDRAATRQGS